MNTEKSKTPLIPPAGRTLRGLAWIVVGILLAALMQSSERETGALFIFSGIIAGVLAHGLESAALYGERKGSLVIVRYGRFILAANPAIILLNILHGRLALDRASARLTTLLLLGPALILGFSLRTRLAARALRPRPAKPRFLSILDTGEEVKR